MTVTSSSNYGSMVDAWAHRALLVRPKPHNVHTLFCTPFALPSKNTKTMAMRKQENLNSDPAILPETFDPEPEQVRKFDINVTVSEFGKVVLLSRDVLLTAEDDTAQGTADNLSQCMHTMIDKVTRNVWASSIAQISCVNGINGLAITELSQIDVNRAGAYLDENNTEKMTPTVPASGDFGTAPISASFWATAHVKIKPDIKKLPMFVPTSGYGRQETVLQSELGSTDETRWVTSTNVYVTTDANPVYYNTFIGANAVGCVTIDEVSTEMIMKPLGSFGYTNRFQSMAFTAYYNAVILDDSHIVTLLSTKAAA